MPEDALLGFMRKDLDELKKDIKDTNSNVATIDRNSLKMLGYLETIDRELKELKDERSQFATKEDIQRLEKNMSAFGTKEKMNSLSNRIEKLEKEVEANKNHRTRYQAVIAFLVVLMPVMLYALGLFIG